MKKNKKRGSWACRSDGGEGRERRRKKEEGAGRADRRGREKRTKKKKKRGCWAYRSERGEGIGGREVKKKKK
jgi:hypothetical protein